MRSKTPAAHAADIVQSLSRLASEDPRSTETLAALRDVAKAVASAYEVEIIRLASFADPVDQGEIALAAGRTRAQIGQRERAAGLPPRRPGGRGRIESTGSVRHAA
jgi:hypothetical protein